MIRKKFETGNSMVVSLPKDALEYLNLSDGAGVTVELDQTEKKIIISPAELPLAASGVDETFAQQVDIYQSVSTRS
jgi:antitoxin component of MazEF toxin-antitoxin module